MGVNLHILLAIHEQKLQEMQDAQTAQQRIALQAAREKASMEVTAFASEAVTVGDAAYSGAAGVFTKTSTSAVLVGKWAQTTAANTLGVVLIETVA